MGKENGNNLERNVPDVGETTSQKIILSLQELVILVEKKDILSSIVPKGQDQWHQRALDGIVRQSRTSHKGLRDESLP